MSWFKKALRIETTYVKLQATIRLNGKTSEASLFRSAVTCKKHNPSKEDGLSHYANKTRFASKCILHVKPIMFSRIYRRSCTRFVAVIKIWTFFLHYLRKETLKKSLQKMQLFKVLQGLMAFNKQHRRVDKMPSFAGKTLSKKIMKQFLRSFHNPKSTDNSGKVFTEKIEHGKKLQFELEPLKFFDFFLDSYGKDTSNRVTFETIPTDHKQLNQFFKLKRDLYKTIGRPKPIANAVNKTPKSSKTHTRQTATNCKTSTCHTLGKLPFVIILRQFCWVQRLR